MAIRLPGISEQLAPIMPGIASLLKNIANPNMDQQVALREALLSGRIDPQTLVDMGPEEVEKRFGKGTGHYASGNKSLKSRVEGLKGEEIQNLLALDPNDPRRQEFIAGLTGIKDPTERKLGEQNVTRNDQIITEGQRQAQEAERKAAARLNVNQWRMKAGNPDNIYLAKVEGKMPGEVLRDVMLHDETKDEYLSQQRDYWAKAEDEYRKKALNERTDPLKAAQEHNIINARKIADQSNMSNVEDILLVLKDRNLEKEYSGKPEPKTPAQKRIWDAVKAVEMSRTMEGDDRKRSAWEYFRRQTAGITGALRDKKVTTRPESEILGLVDQYNTLANQLLGPYLTEKELPQIAYDKKSPRSKDAGFMFFDAPGLYFTQGSDSDLGSENVATKDPLESYRGRSKQEIDAALSRMTDSTAQANLRQKLIKAGIYR